MPVYPTLSRKKQNFRKDPSLSVVVPILFLEPSRVSRSRRDALAKGHPELVEWIGCEFDPEKYDLKLVNEELPDLR